MGQGTAETRVSQHGMPPTGVVRSTTFPVRFGFLPLS